MEEEPLVDSEGGPDRIAVTYGNRTTNTEVLKMPIEGKVCFKKAILLYCSLTISLPMLIIPLSSLLIQAVFSKFPKFC